MRRFKDALTKDIWDRHCPKGLSSDLAKQAYRKILLVHEAVALRDLRIPPGNHLEELRGNRKGQYSIRVNKQWRVCFVWTEEGAYQIEFTDYH